MGAFVVDRTGTIRISYVEDDYSRRLDPDAVAETLKRLQS